ncbi:dodecin family protein [Frigidibacter sp. MR17.24]|uniref:dodecin family protein n=1 Tax=Frigidibacter sp. MR17.24 TaxID=3127345 RepID=UPI003012C794
MSVASISEIIATSNTGFEDAVAQGIRRASQTLRNIRSAWVKDHEVTVEDGRPALWKVTLKVTFVMED